MLNKIRYEKDYAVLEITRKGTIIDVLIDIEDVEKVSKYRSWHAILDKTLQTPSYYIAYRYNNKLQGKGVIKLHRLITNCPKNMVVDHINHNTCDNRKKNLKVCTNFENQQNLRSKKSIQTGVYKRTRNNREFWVANISKDKKKYTKDFDNIAAAIEWRKIMEKQLYKEVV
ncbi:MAG: HNH endonuclease [Turicibacter sp.]|nr:HNH endonuclease [Turicibacter sp.]